jgi:hypothetical protein
MKNRLSDGAGYKTVVGMAGDVQTTVTLRRLPMRPGENESRYRVRIVRSNRNGVVLSNNFRDMDISKAFRVLEQNRARLV